MVAAAASCGQRGSGERGPSRFPDSLGPGVLSLLVGLRPRAAEAASPQDAPPRFVPADVFVGIICGFGGQRI